MGADGDLNAGHGRGRPERTLELPGDGVIRPGMWLDVLDAREELPGVEDAPWPLAWTAGGIEVVSTQSTSPVGGAASVVGHSLRRSEG